MKTLEELLKESGIEYSYFAGSYVAYRENLERLYLLTAREVAQDIADNIRETYLHHHAEMLAFNIETLYGVHGDYGDR